MGACFALLLCAAAASSALAAKSTSPEGHGARRLLLGRSAAPANVSPSAYPTITFDDVPEGTFVSDQYEGDGVVFTSPVFTSEDEANPTSPVLSGEPLFEGEIEGEFVNPATGTPQTVTTFTLDVGYINNRDSVMVEAWDSTGRTVQSALADEFGINTVTLTYRGMAGFSVHEVSSEPAGFAIDNLSIDPTGNPQTIRSAAALGDSYSSGEGLEPGKGTSYDCGTDMPGGLYYQDTTLPTLIARPWTSEDCDTRTLSNTEPPLFSRPPVWYENTCHRHGLAYPEQIMRMLGATQSIFVACSGATTANVGEIPQTAKAQHPHSPVNVAGGNTQATDVENFDSDHLGGKDPDLITIGIGGNDAGFSSIAKSCIVTLTACSSDESFVETVLNKINGVVYDNLLATFEGLRDDHPDSTIVAFGYPSPVSATAPFCAGAPIRHADLEFLQETVLPALNEVVADAAAGAGISYVDISRVTEGHEVCTTDPWFRGLSSPVVASFHPTQKAHQAIADYFKAHYTDGHGGLLIRNPPFAGDPIPPVVSGVVGSIGNLQGGPEVPCGAGCAQSVPCIQSCSVLIQGSGYAPGAKLDAVLHSAERDLGEVTADSEGEVEATFEIPRGVEPGTHIITLNGTGPFGEPQYGSLGFEVLEGTSGAESTHPPGGNSGGNVLGTTARKVRVGAKIRLRWKGRHLIARVSCPAKAVSPCKVTMSLQRRRSRHRHAVYVLLRHAALVVPAGRTKTLSLQVGAIAASHRNLRMLAGAETAIVPLPR